MGCGDFAMVLISKATQLGEHFNINSCISNRVMLLLVPDIYPLVNNLIPLYQGIGENLAKPGLIYQG